MQTGDNKADYAATAENRSLAVFTANNNNLRDAPSLSTTVGYDTDGDGILTLAPTPLWFVTDKPATLKVHATHGGNSEVYDDTTTEITDSTPETLGLTDRYEAGNIVTLDYSGGKGAVSQIQMRQPLRSGPVTVLSSGSIEQSADVVPGTRYVFSFNYSNSAGNVAAIRVYDNTNFNDIIPWHSLPDNLLSTSAHVIFSVPSGCGLVTLYAQVINQDIIPWTSLFGETSGATAYVNTFTTPAGCTQLKLCVGATNIGDEIQFTTLSLRDTDGGCELILNPGFTEWTNGELDYWTRLNCIVFCYLAGAKIIPTSPRGHVFQTFTVEPLREYQLWVYNKRITAESRAEARLINITNGEGQFTDATLFVPLIIEDTISQTTHSSVELISNRHFVDWTGPNADDWTAVDCTPTETTEGVQVAATADNGHVHQTLTVVAETEHLLSLWHMQENAGSVPRIRLYDVTNSANIIAWVNLSSSTANFVHYTIYFTTPAACVQVRLYLGAEMNTDIVHFAQAGCYNPLLLNSCQAVLQSSGSDSYKNPYFEDWTLGLCDYWTRADAVPLEVAQGVRIDVTVEEP